MQLGSTVDSRRIVLTLVEFQHPRRDGQRTASPVTRGKTFLNLGFMTPRRVGFCLGRARLLMGRRRRSVLRRLGDSLRTHGGNPENPNQLRESISGSTDTMAISSRSSIGTNCSAATARFACWATEITWTLGALY